ncbi:MAG: hypothetical protein AAGA03_18835, partial [Planctomycetota bacterium]
KGRTSDSTGTQINMQPTWQPGDWAIYRKSKRSVNPGPRAVAVVGTDKGDTYAYLVDKFWVVEDVLEDGRVCLVTARGKRHIIASSDPNLRRASWFKKLWYASRFRAAEESLEPNQAAGVLA